MGKKRGGKRENESAWEPFPGGTALPADDPWAALLARLPAGLRRLRACAESLEEQLAERLGELEPPAEELLRFIHPLLGQGPPDEEWMTFAAVHLMHHWRVGGRKGTVAEQVLADASALEADERELLLAIGKTPASLYEVVDNDVRRGLKLADRFRPGAEVRVQGEDQALLYDVGELLPARVVPAGRYNDLQLVGIPVPDTHAAAALEWLEARFQEFARRAGTLDRDAFLAKEPQCVPQASMVARADLTFEDDGQDDELWAEADPSAAPKPRRSPSGKLYELEIELVGSRPAVRRVLAVAADRTLDDLHYVIQAVMGWQNSHLHLFRGGRGDAEWRCADPRQGVEEAADEARTTLAEAAPRKGSRFTYEYDFGDGWVHEIRVRESKDLDDEADEPVCLDGANACPPEDSGGVHGYAWMLEVLGDPTHEEYASYREWLPKDFDPGRFDVAEANRRIRSLFE